jgi:hypothetical protein
MSRLSIFIIFIVIISACSGTQNEEKADASAEAEQPEEEMTIPLALSINGNDDATAAEISQQLAEVLLQEDIEFLTPEQRRFRYAITDLNDDGNREYLIEFRNSYFCGSGGCTYLLLDSDMELITRFTVSDAPFIISEEKSSGWRDLIIPEGGSYHVMKFDGNTYPSNPSVEPEAMVDEQAEPIRLLDESAGDLKEFTF